MPQIRGGAHARWSRSLHTYYDYEPAAAASDADADRDTGSGSLSNRCAAGLAKGEERKGEAPVGEEAAAAEREDDFLRGRAAARAGEATAPAGALLEGS